MTCTKVLPAAILTLAAVTIATIGLADSANAEIIKIPVAAFDVNDGGSPTQSGFEGLSSTMTGTQNGVTLTSTSSAPGFEFRDRGASGDLSGHPLAALLQDFGFENDGSTPRSITFDLTGLEAAMDYELTVYSYDRTSNNGVTNDWYEDSIGGTPLFTSTIDSDNPDAAGFTLNLTSDGSGAIRFVGASDQLVIFNGLEVAQVLAIPEPASFAVWSMIGLGLIGCGWYRRYGRK